MRLMGLATALALLATTGAAEAWEYTVYDADDSTWLSAHQKAAGGRPFELAVTCSQDLADQADVAVYADGEWPAAYEAGTDIPMSFTIDGETIGVLGDFGEFDMRRMVVAPDTGDPEVRTIFTRLAAATQPITVEVAGETLTFPADGAKKAVGKFLEHC
jgi:hypothetical protein